ncbi:MAG: hypothetical protein ACYTJ0_15440 [Planctomycetota bacterium]|jgi:hypothetical protein
MRSPRLPRSAAALALFAGLFAAGCQSSNFRTELEVGPEETVDFVAIGERPAVAVVNAGPGWIVVTFDADGETPVGPFDMPPDSVMASQVGDTNLVRIETDADGSYVRVRATRAEGIEGPGEVVQDKDPRWPVG